jgi:hypothetical protein
MISLQSFVHVACTKWMSLVESGNRHIQCPDRTLKKERHAFGNLQDISPFLELHCSIYLVGECCRLVHIQYYGWALTLKCYMAIYFPL